MMSEQRFVHYRVGNVQQDQQHWDLLKQMDVLVDAIKHHQPCADLIVTMVRMLSLHLCDETKIMESIEYPYIVAHTADHDRLVRRLTVLVDELSRGVFGSSVSIQHLETMFLDHITYHDMQYVEWVKTKASSLSVEPSLPGQAS